MSYQMKYGKVFNYLIPFLLVCHFSCSQENIEFVETSPSKLLSRVGNNEPDKLVNNANTILRNYINLNGGWKSVKYDELDWSVDPYKNPSWKTYFFSLRMIAVLTKAYEEEADEKYLIKAKEILYSWNSNYKSESLFKKKEVGYLE